MIAIEKLARNEHRARRPWRMFANARSAFAAFLKAAAPRPDEFVLLPAYIGWSANEGSGVFDPVAALSLSHAFYRVDSRLRIDLEHMEQLFRNRPVKALVLIHYFGHVDPGYRDAVALARAHGALVLEDEAHAMLTDLVGGISGRAGDAAIFSLHKLLPMRTGGMLVVNASGSLSLSRLETPPCDAPAPWEYDLAEIAARRRHCARLMVDCLRPLEGEIEPLWDGMDEREVPQTLPILVRNVSRDRLYFDMNAAGYGVVSLYHTLIDRITADAFPESHHLARRILNLPVHQDIEPETARAMIERLQWQIEQSPRTSS